MAQREEKRDHQAVEQQRTADNLEEKQRSLLYQKQVLALKERKLALRERKIDFYFPRLVFIALLVFLGYLLVKSSLWGIPVGIAAMAMFYALQFTMSMIRQKPEDGLAHDVKSLLHIWIEEKIARRLLLRH